MSRYVTSRDSILLQYEKEKLMEGPLIKLGDYAHFRYFVLYHNGRLCYYEIPMLKEHANVDAKDPVLVRARYLETMIEAQSAEHLRGVMILRAAFRVVSDDKEQKCRSLAGNEAWQRDSNNALDQQIVLYPKRLEFGLTGYSLSGQLTFWRLRAANKRLYENWVGSFRIALRPVWIPNTSHCLICQSQFTLLTRPHHCRKCGNCICFRCSSYIARLPMQGYEAEVRVCRDCSLLRVDQLSQLIEGTRVLVYGMYPGHIASFLDFTTEKAGVMEDRLVRVFLEQSDKKKWREGYRLKYIELYSEIVMYANRIKCAIKRHLCYSIFRAKLNFSTWNALEAAEENKTIKIGYQGPTIGSLHALIPRVTSFRNFYDQIDCNDPKKHEEASASLSNYHGVHVTFPLRLETVLKLIDQFKREVVLHRIFVHLILMQALKEFDTYHSTAMNKICIAKDARVVVVGDLHGQLEDLLTVFDKNGIPDKDSLYIFNGDYVDRGAHGVEVMILLICFKLLYPEYTYLNRGNHEQGLINEVFGFAKEVHEKYGLSNGIDDLFDSKYTASNILGLFEQLYELIPLFSVVNGRVFIVHGGLSRHGAVKIEELAAIDHRRGIPTQSIRREDDLFADLLWSDPCSELGVHPSDRGAGIRFGPDITRAFCDFNDIDLVIRSHECETDGYVITHDGLLLTVFSASSYCGIQSNKGAYVELHQTSSGFIKAHVVQFYSLPFMRLKNGVRNGWRERAQLLERQTICVMKRIMHERREKLFHAFVEMDVNDTGKVSKIIWEQVLGNIISVNIRYLLYEDNLLGGIGRMSKSDDVDYRNFLLAIGSNFKD